MGKGDKKTRRGKIINGSFGVRRPKHKRSNDLVTEKKKIVLKAEAAEKTAKKQAPVKTTGNAIELAKPSAIVKVETKKEAEPDKEKKTEAAKSAVKKKTAGTKETKEPKEKKTE